MKINSPLDNRNPFTKFKILRLISSQQRLTSEKSIYEELAANNEGKYRIITLTRFILLKVK